ncbi:MAG: hypothetical protein AAF915_23985 [Cyanobacteria bacterium P01_D01_bin.50]
MSKYEFSRLQNLISKYHNFQVLREINEKDTKKSRQNIYSKLLIKNTYTAQLIILKILFFWISNGNIEKLVNAVVSLPASWSIKPGSFIPQLVIIFRIKGKTRSGNYSLHIPHYNGEKKPSLSSYQKGSFMTTLILKDGSSLVVNASSKREGERVVNQFSRYILSKYLSKDVRHSQNNKVKNDEMIPVRADYYPNGQEEAEPLWRYYF